MPLIQQSDSDIISNPISHNRSKNLGSYRSTKGPQGLPAPYDITARRAQSDEPLDGAAVTSPTSSQQSHSKEARPADNQTTAVAATPSRGHPTTAGRRNANELDIKLDSPSLGEQPVVGVGNPRHTITRPIPPAGSPSVSASRGPQATQNERIMTPGAILSSASMKLHAQSHPAAIPSSSGIAPPARALQEAGSKTSRRPPQAEEPEKMSRSPAPQIGFARDKDASRPSAEQLDRTAPVQPPAEPFAHPSPSLNRPGVSTSPSSYPAAQTLIKTASNRMQVVRGTLRDEPQARSGTALSELVPPDEDKRKAPHEQGPKNPIGTPIELPQPSEHAPSSTEPLSRHQPVPNPGHLNRSHSLIQGNEGGDREDKRTKGGANPQKGRQLPVVLDERRHAIAQSPAPEHVDGPSESRLPEPHSFGAPTSPFAVRPRRKQQGERPKVKLGSPGRGSSRTPDSSSLGLYRDQPAAGPPGPNQLPSPSPPGPGGTPRTPGRSGPSVYPPAVQPEQKPPDGSDCYCIDCCDSYYFCF